jgi:Na+/H+ antiporter NhaD/arsenite permease-like protein
MEAGGIEAAPLWWTLVLTANLGGNSTPVGSISSVIAIHALEKERHIKIGWGEFLKVGGTVLAIQGVVVIVYLLLFSWGNLFPAGTE